MVGLRMHLGLLLVLFAPRLSVGDVFHLASGGQIEGDLLNLDENPREKYIIRTTFGAELTLGTKQVQKRVVRKQAEAQYEERVHGLTNDVEHHLEIAEWCLQNGLEACREYHMQAVLKLDPNNGTARTALGFMRRGGQWMTPDDIRRRQGYVRYKNTWRLPQELEIVLAKEKYDQGVLEWKRRLKILRQKIIERGDGRAIDELRAIDDPLAAPVLIDFLDDKNEPTRMKLMYIEVLTRIGGSGAVFAFVQRAVVDEDSSVRDRCINALAKESNRQAAALFARYLHDDNPAYVNQAGYALGEMGVRDHTLEMIRALITKHKRIIGGDSGGGTGISLGPGGLSVGGNKPQLITRESQNEGVLAGLVALYPGTNYRFDVDTWKEWWASKTTPRVVNLRRSE